MFAILDFIFDVLVSVMDLMIDIFESLIEAIFENAWLFIIAVIITISTCTFTIKITYHTSNNKQIPIEIEDKYDSSNLYGE